MQMPEHRAPHPPHSIASIIIWLSYSPPQLLADEVRGCHTLLGLLRRRHREGGPLQWPWDLQRCRRRASGRSYAFFRTVFYVPYAATSRHGLIHEDHTLLRCSFPPPAPSQRSASATRASMDVIASVLRVWRAPTVKLTAVGMPPQQNIAPMLVYAILQERR